MYSQQKQRTTHYCQHELLSALLRLMEHHSLKDITITQICQEAQVSRTSFYRNFEDKEGILVHYLEQLVAQYTSTHTAPTESIIQASQYVYQFIYENKPFLKLLQNHNMLTIIKKTDFLARSSALYVHSLHTFYREPEFEHYLDRILLEAQYVFIDQWLQDDCTAPVEKLSTLSVRVLSNLNPKWMMDWEQYCLQMQQPNTNSIQK